MMICPIVAALIRKLRRLFARASQYNLLLPTKTRSLNPQMHFITLNELRPDDQLAGTDKNCALEPKKQTQCARK